MKILFKNTVLTLAICCFLTACQKETVSNNTDKATEEQIRKILKSDIEPERYDEVYPFTDGLAAVKRDNKIGFIDKTGQIVIPIKYDDTSLFFNNRAGVEIQGKKGIIDKNGNTIIPIKYDGLLNCMSNFTIAFSDEDMSIFNCDGNRLHNKIRMYRVKHLGRQELFAGMVALNQWQIFNIRTMQTINDEIYEDVKGIDNDLGVLVLYLNGENSPIGIKKNNQWGFIDKTGKLVIPFQYDDITLFNDGLAGVKKNDKYGFIDETGKDIIPKQYDDITLFINGFAAVAKKINPEQTKWGFIDKSGKEIIPIKYDDVESFDDNGLSVVRVLRTNSLMDAGVIDKTGKEIISITSNDISGYTNGLAVKYEDNAIGYIDNKGEWKIKFPTNFTEICSHVYIHKYYNKNGLTFKVVDFSEKGEYSDKTGIVLVQEVQSKITAPTPCLEIPF